MSPIVWYSVPCQSLCITASLIILLNWVTPVWRWQMVRQNNASHFNAVQYCVTEQLSRIPSGSDPFLDTLNICTRIFQKRSRQMGRFDFTCLFCTREIFSESIWQMLFFECKTTADCVTDSKQCDIMVFSFRFNVVKYFYIICYMLLKSKAVHSQRPLCSSVSAQDAQKKKIIIES